MSKHGEFALTAVAISFLDKHSMELQAIIGQDFLIETDVLRWSFAGSKRRRSQIVDIQHCLLCVYVKIGNKMGVV